jgi:hypothetical protein
MQIRFTQKCVFRDWHGNVLKVYEIGDTCEATHDTGFYFVTTFGGIYHTEAELVSE